MGITWRRWSSIPIQKHILNILKKVILNMLHSILIDQKEIQVNIIGNYGNWKSTTNDRN